MSTRAAINQVRSTLTSIERLGGSIPKNASAKINQALDAAESAQRWGRDSDPTPLTRAALDAISAGRDPLEDPEVLRAVVGDRIQTSMPAILELAGTRVQAVAAEHIDDLIHAFDAPFDTAAARLSAGRDWLAGRGITHDSDPAAVLNLGPEAAAKWADAGAAVETLTRIRNVIVPLLVMLEVHIPQPVLTYVDPTGHDITDVGALGRNPHWWAALDAGMSLSLAGRDEAHERMSRAHDERDRRQRAAATESARAWPMSF